MKKLICAILAMAMLFALCACGGSNDNQQASVADDSLQLLQKVWASYSDDEAFPAAGGDFNEENMCMDGPGNFGIDDTDALDATLALPADAAELIDNAASLTHMMNANTFTAGAFHLGDAANTDELVEALKNSIANRQWMCGMPDEYGIITVGDYVIFFFGEKDLASTFKDKVLACYEGAQLVCEEAIVID